jgi:WD40 repeat protein
MVKLWDVRNMSEPMVSVREGSEQGISQLRWSVEEREKLWVVAGNNMTLWDMNEERALFEHAGHMENINQMDLHPVESNTVVSVDDNHDIQVFQPTRNAFI